MERKQFILLICLCLLFIGGCGHQSTGDPIVSAAKKYPFDFKLPTWLPFKPNTKKVPKRNNGHFSATYKKGNQEVYLDLKQTFYTKLNDIGRKPDVTLKNGRKATFQRDGTELVWIDDNVQYYIELEGSTVNHKPKKTLLKIANSFKPIGKIKESP